MLLSSRPYTIRFKNGIIDFTTRKFINNMNINNINQYSLSVSLKIDYVELKSNDYQITIINEINHYMAQLFPELELRQYMWDHFVSILVGNNKNGCHIYMGNSENGKSSLIQFLNLAFGDYSEFMPFELLCGQIPHNSFNNELIHLKGKRYIVCKEHNNNDDIINENSFKKIIGGHSIQYNLPYNNKKNMTFDPQFEIIIPINCNKQIIPYTACDSIWNHIKVIPFDTNFVENPNPLRSNEIQKDKYISRKFEKWAPIFISMLVKRAFVYNCQMIDTCSIVEYTTKQYHHLSVIK